MANILISGWYGFANVGDEAILSAIIKTIIKEMPATGIKVLSFNPRATSFSQGVSSVYRLPQGLKSWTSYIFNGNARQTFKAFNWCDVLLLGGGGFLSDWQPESPWFWLRQTLIARLLGKKVMLYGIGAGPFTRIGGKWFTKVLINNCVQAVTVRDEKSKEWLVKCGVRENLIEVTADPAMRYAIPLKLKPARYPMRVGVCVAPIFHIDALWPGKRYKYDRYREAFKDVVLKLAAAGFTVTFIPMQESVDFPFAHEILDSIPKCADVAAIPPDLDNAVALLGKVDILIAMRLHAAILGAQQGIPVAGIIYHHKVAEFLANIGLTEYAVEIGDGSNWHESDIDPESMVRKVMDIASDYEPVRQQMLAKLEVLKQKEQGNILSLRRLLEMTD